MTNIDTVATSATNEVGKNTTSTSTSDEQAQQQQQQSSQATSTAASTTTTTDAATVATSATVATPTTNTSTTSHNNNTTNTNTLNLTDALEERVIDAEYKIWKKNTPFLYDFVLTHSLEWPSLTCQWLPTVKTLSTTTIASSTSSSTATGGATGGATVAASSLSSSSSNNNTTNTTLSVVEHSILIGTHTTGEQNYLMVATCIIPTEEAVIATNQLPKTPSTATNTNTNASSNANSPALRYDDDKKEIGGFGHHSNTNVGKIEIKMKIKHDGEVNRARYMPQNHFIVATRGPSSEVFIWDLSKHPSIPTSKITSTSRNIGIGTSNSIVKNFDTSSLSCPQGVCIGHEKEGYAMVWSKHTTGHLLTGSEDTTVRLWDINTAITSSSSSSNATTKSSTSSGMNDAVHIQPLVTMSTGGHTDTVEDVDWHTKDPQLVISVGDDQRICLWDIRESTKPKHTIDNGHTSDINCVAFNPINENLFATGSADTTVAVWDIRNLTTKLHTLQSHTDQVFKVEWAPFNESILGSCSADRRVALWDLSRIGVEQCPEDAEDGPPELLFLHGGHTSKVSDFSWNTTDLWTIASVSEDNVLQVWNIAEEIYAVDDTEDQHDTNSTGAGEDGMLGEDELE